MSRLETRAELARWAGVSRAAVTKACKPGGVLFDAFDGHRVDVEHPVAVDWLDSHGVLVPPGPGRPDPKVETGGRRPARDKTPTPKKPRAKSDGPTQIGGIPIEDLEDLTVREVVLRYGSVDGFRRFVDSLKGIAEYKHRELRVRQQRGLLVERERVAGVVFPMIDVAFDRLVSDVPDSLGPLILARAEAGGPEAQADIAELIREANSKVLQSVKHNATRSEVLKDAG